MQDRYVPTPSDQGPTSPPAPALPEPKVNDPPAAVAAATAPVPQKVERPTELPEPQLSKSAIDKRLRRIVSPRSDGSYIIPEEFIKKYNGGERAELLFLFEKCGHDPDSSGYFGVLSLMPLQTTLGRRTLRF